MAQTFKDLSIGAQFQFADDTARQLGNLPLFLSAAILVKLSARRYSVRLGNSHGKGITIGTVHAAIIPHTEPEPQPACLQADDTADMALTACQSWDA